MSPLAYLAIGYLVGTVPFGYIAGKMKGIDIRKEGSGNIGATNVLRVLGTVPGIVVLILDVLKGAVPALLARQALNSPDWGLYAGLCALVGHTLSPFLGFKGGKGIATGLGALLGGATSIGLAALGVFMVGMAITLMVSVSSVAAAIAIPILAVATHRSTTVLCLLTAIGLFIIYKHKSNIGRVKEGTEPILGQKVGEPRPDGTKARIICSILAVLCIAGFVSMMMSNLS